MSRTGLLATILAAVILLLSACGGTSPSTTATVTTSTPTETAVTPTETTTTGTTATTETASSTTSAPGTATATTPSATVTETAETPVALDYSEGLDNHFGFMPARWNYEGAGEAGGAWDRPFFELFQWGLIEVVPGEYLWHETDQQVRDSGEAGLHIIANIHPFAAWDQETCHGDLPVIDAAVPPEQQSSRGKPCDMEAYQDFLTQMVERYDGDGMDDMPGLSIPVKHWEVMNEPEFQDMYFQGTPEEYVETLAATYEAVKAADPEASIVQGGMAGMMDESVDFWQGVFDAGGGQYFDIMNMHSIGHGEHLNLPAFSELLEANGLQDKPVWVTEVQYQQSQMTENLSNEQFAAVLGRSYVYALAHGADKLFYVNIQMPPGWDDGQQQIPFGPESALFTDNGEPTAMFEAHRTIANLLGDLAATDPVTIISERVGEWHIEAGQYAFTMGDRTVYALFGDGDLPAALSGEVTVIDLSGTETALDAAAVTLTDSPIFIVVD